MRCFLSIDRLIGTAVLVASVVHPCLPLLAQTSDPFAQGQAQGQAEAATEEHPLAPAIRLAESSLATVSQLDDYTATLTKRELINGSLVTQVMNLKFRDEPFSVYLE